MARKSAGEATRLVEQALKDAHTAGRPVTAHEIAMSTGVGYSAVTENLRDLKACNVAASSKRGRTSVWTLSAEAPGILADVAEIMGDPSIAVDDPYVAVPRSPAVTRERVAELFEVPAAFLADPSDGDAFTQTFPGGTDPRLDDAGFGAPVNAEYDAMRTRRPDPARYDDGELPPPRPVSYHVPASGYAAAVDATVDWDALPDTETLERIAAHLRDEPVKAAETSETSDPELATPARVPVGWWAVEGVETVAWPEGETCHALWAYTVRIRDMAGFGGWTLCSARTLFRGGTPDMVADEVYAAAVACWEGGIQVEVWDGSADLFDTTDPEFPNGGMAWPAVAAVRGVVPEVVEPEDEDVLL